MGPSPLCYILSFMAIGLVVLEKMVFEGFFAIYGHGDHHGHVTLTQGQEMTLTSYTHITPFTHLVDCIY